MLIEQNRMKDQQFCNMKKFKNVFLVYLVALRLHYLYPINVCCKPRLFFLF